MTVPYPSSMTAAPPRAAGARMRARWCARNCRERWVNLLVLGLNYMALGMPSISQRAHVPFLGPGGVGTPVPADVLALLSRSVAGMLRAQSGGGGKAADLQSAAQAAKAVAGQVSPYLRAMPGQAMGSFQVGKPDRGAMSITCADQVALPKRGSFFAPPLSGSLGEAYWTPASLLEGASAEDEGVVRKELDNRCVYKVSPAVEAPLLRRLDAANMLRIAPVCQDAVINGMFAVPKSGPPDAQGRPPVRLVFDRRPQNSLERLCADAARRVASPVCLLDLFVGPDSKLLLWTTDISNYYYCFAVSRARAESNRFGKPRLGSSFRGFACHKPRWDELPVTPCLSSLAMGDKNATGFAQEAHMRLMVDAQVFPESALMIYGEPLPTRPVVHGMIIDDHLQLAVVPRVGGAAEIARAQEEWDRSLDAYVQADLVTVPRKTVTAVTETAFWGAEVRADPESGPTIGTPAGKRLGIVQATLGFVEAGRARVVDMQRLLGCWVPALMFRRDAMSVVGTLVQCLHPDRDPHSVFRLSASHRSELALLAVLAPLLQADLGSPMADVLWATDASLTGGGICSTSIPVEVGQELWRNRARKGKATPLQGFDALYRMHLGEDPPDTVEEHEKAAALWGSELVSSLAFQPTARWLLPTGHINVQEARARTTLTRHLTARPAFRHKRHVVAMDSRVTIGAAAKGRSSARSMNHELRKAAAHTLAGGVGLGAMWVNSESNPADGLSRKEHGCPAPTTSPAAWIAPWTRALVSGRDSGLGPGSPASEAGDGPERSRAAVILTGRAMAPATVERRRRALRAFRQWCTAEAWDTVCAGDDARTIDALLAAYGQQVYDSNGSLSVYRDTILGVVDSQRHLRRVLPGAWDGVTAWEALEPSESHTPLPLAVALGFVVVALSWGWLSLGALLALGFHTALRPGEMLNLRVSDVLFPEDLMHSREHGFVVIREPKTRRIGGRFQHVRFDGPFLMVLVRAAVARARGRPGEDDAFVWGAAHGAATRARRFRLEFDSIMQAMGVPLQGPCAFVPSSVRAGAATAWYDAGWSIADIRWLGRWTATATLEHYIQELAATRASARLPAETRDRLTFLRGQLPALLLALPTGGG